MSNVVAIIPARSDSLRLPAKHLRMLHGYTMLELLIRRMRGLDAIHAVTVATTDRAIDDTLAAAAQRYGAHVFRGDCDDVLGRVAAAARNVKARIVVKANGDNPLQAPEVIQRGLDQLESKGLDLVTGKNAYTGLPIGLGAELLTVDALERLDREAPPRFRESTTGLVFEQSGKWRWAPIECPETWRYPDASVSVDTLEDFERISSVVQRLPESKPEQWTIEMILKTLEPT